MKFVFVALQLLSVVSYAQRMRQLCSVAHLGLHARALGFRLNITTTIVDAAITLYETEYATSVCHRDPALRTLVTTNGGNRALFAGAGSTGSRWLSCAVEVALGIEVGHYVEGNGTAFVHPVKDLADFFANFRSDPVPGQHQKRFIGSHGQISP